MPIFTQSKTGLKLTALLLIFIVFLQLISPLFLQHARAADESVDAGPITTENIQSDKQGAPAAPEDDVIDRSEDSKVVDNADDVKEESGQLDDSVAESSSVGGVSKVLNDRSVVKTDLPKVDQVTGALSFAVPITTPPGRGGVQPDIALQYNSQDKNIFSPFGYGWSLNIPYIKRYQAPGALNQYSTDTYESSLVGKLVLAQNQPGDGRKLFQPRVEQVQPWQFYLGQDDVWTVYDTAGHTYRFGSVASARQDSSQTGTYRWMLSEQVDTYDNAIIYSYVKQSGYVYPDRIVYTSHPLVAAAYEIEFQWGPTPYPRNDYRPGFRVITERKLDKILVKYGSDIIQRYTIGYQSSISNVISLVAFVRQEYRDSQGVLVALPDTTFEYPPLEDVTGWQVADDIQFPFTDSGGNIRFGEFNGDGLSDFMQGSTLYTNSGVRWNPANGANAPYISNPSSGFNDAFEMLDYNVDGLVDYFAAIGNVSLNPNFVHNATFYANTGGGGFAQDERPIKTPPQVTTNNCDSGNPCDHAGLRILDLNGDGLSDMLQGFSFNRYDPLLGAYSERLINRAHFGKFDAAGLLGWQEGYWGQVPVFEKETSGSTPNKILEMNGDGLPDFLQFQYYTETNPRYAVYQNQENTTQNWIDPGTGVIVIAEAAYPNTHRMTDVNGDGLTDIAIAANYYSASCSSDCDHRRQVILNQGNTFNSNPNAWQLPEGLYFLKALSQQSSGLDSNPHGAFADVNGDGAEDIVIFQSGTSSVYLNKSAYAYVPKKIGLPEGGSLSIAYKPAAQYRGFQNVWLNHIPFPVITVSGITMHDGVNSVMTESYVYEDGAYVSLTNGLSDPRFMLERQVGFGKVTTVRGDGSSVVAYYHQGNGQASQEPTDHTAQFGKLYRQEWYGGSGALLRVVATTWRAQDMPATSGTGHWFVSPTTVVTAEYGAGGVHKDVAMTYSYDPVSFTVTSEVNHGEVVMGDRGLFTDVGNDAIITNRLFVSGNQRLASLPAVVTVTDQAGNKRSEFRSYYDGLPFQQAAKGSVTAEEQWIVEAVYATRQKTYSAFGLVMTETNPLGGVVTNVYDGNQLFPVTVTGPLGHVTTYQYDYFVGKATRITHPNGSQEGYVYDSLGRVVAVQSSHPTTGQLATTATFSYGQVSPSFSVTTTLYLSDQLIRQEVRYLDGFGRVRQDRRQAENGNFTVVDTLYDSVGRLYRQSAPYYAPGLARTPITADSSLFTTTLYDGLDRPVSVQNNIGTITTGYDGWTKRIVNALGNRKDLIVDAFGRLSQVVEYIGGQTATTSYRYDSNGNLISLTDAQGNVRAFSYDAMNRRIFAEDLHAPGDTLFGAYTWAYDPAGNMVRQTDPNNQVVVYTYDLASRLLSEDFTGQPGTEVTYAYDQCAYGNGTLCGISRSDFSLAQNYTPAGQISSETKTIGGSSYTTSYTYDLQGNLLSIAHPDASVTKHDYNLFGLMETVSYKAAGSSEYTPVINNIDYAPHGGPSIQTAANGTATTWTYDSAKQYRLTRKLTSSGSVAIQDINYTYDAGGNITQLLDNSASASAKRVSYTYDSLDRLLSASAVSLSDQQVYDHAYTYDSIGNIKSRSESLTGGLPVTFNYSYEGVQEGNYANPHAVTRITGGDTETSFAYDRNGNLTAEGEKSYVWDYNNRLLSVVSAAPESAPVTERFYAHGGDGSLYKAAASWSNAHDALTAAGGDSIGNALHVRTGRPNTNYRIDRGFFPFDTSSLPDDAVVTDAQLKVYAAQVSNNDNDGDDWVTVVQTSQPTPENLTTADYDLAGTVTSPLEGVDAPNRKDITTVTPGSWLAFNLNALGISWIQPTGITKLGLREGHDVLNTPVSGSAGQYNHLQIRASNYSGTTFDPVLEVTYQQSSQASSAITYTYDHTGQRIRQDNGTTAVVYPSRFYNTDSNGKKTKHLFSTEQVATIEDTTLFFTHTDHLSGQGLTTTTAGTIIETTDYYPYGSLRLNEKTTSFSEQRKFTGHEYDTDTGLTYANARYYNSVIGRFVSQDAVFWATPVEYLVDPQQWNSYSYARNNPIVLTDPTGNISIRAVFNSVKESVTSFFSNLFSTSHNQQQIPKTSTPTVSVNTPTVNTYTSKTTTWDPVSDKRIAQLDSRLQQPATNFINNVEYEQNVQLRVVQGYRSMQEQNQLYAQGRTAPGNIVTNAKGGDSYHNYGLAFDVVVMEKGQARWDKPINKDIANIAGQQGFEWGGTWSSFPDYPHFQMTFGQSVLDLKKGIK